MAREKSNFRYKFAKRFIRLSLYLFIIILIWTASADTPALSARPIGWAAVEHPLETAAVESLKPTSLVMVDQAISALTPCLKEMDDAHREVLMKIFDPADSGEIDEAYRAVMLRNYQEIRARLLSDFSVQAVEHHMCQGQRLYLTDRESLYLCPYFFQEENQYRQARTLVHEVAHMALDVGDRPYYRPTSQAYKTLTPRGSWAAQLPVIGPLLREELKGDTLYHPDAYAHFAMAVSGLPGSEKYAADNQESTSKPSFSMEIEERELIDSWNHPKN